MSSNLEHRLAEMKRRLQSLPDSKEPPPTLLHILGRRRQEQDWQRLLFHFLSPDEPHGFEHDLLERFLTALSKRDDLDFSFTRFDLPAVQVEQEVHTTRGRPDAVLWARTDWFICWELKIGASEAEGQTPAYVNVESFSGINLPKNDVPRGGRYYLYLAPADAEPPEADEFVHISWEWVASELQSFLANSYGTYPAATTAHLTDFISTIQREFTMTEYQENQQEKAQLCFEYYDEIEEIQQAFENQWKRFADTWGTQLVRTIDDSEVVEVQALPDTHEAIELRNSSGDRVRWMFRQGSDWAGIMKESWWRDRDALTPIYTQADDGNDVRITLYHRLEENRERAVKDQTLELQLWHGTGNGDEFMYRFKDVVSTLLEQNSEEVPAAVEYPGTRGNPVTATYDIPVSEHDDFFKAYLAALHEGFLDLTVRNPGFIELIDEAFEQSLAVYDD